MQNKRIIRVVGWAIAIIFILIVGKITGLLQPVEWVMQTLISPAQGTLYRIGITWFGGQDQVNLEQVQEENESLKSQLNSLLIENTRLKTTVSEIDELKLQLEKINQVGGQAIPAKVISRGLLGDPNTLEINVGKDEGIQEGSAVIAEEGILIGRILRVDSATSLVTLLTSPSIAVAAEVENETLSPGVVAGEHSLALKMSLIPQTENVQVHQVVVTSGADEHIPEKIVIGVITTVTSTPGGLFQEATLTPLFDPENIRLITVVTK